LIGGEGAWGSKATSLARMTWNVGWMGVDGGGWGWRAYGENGVGGGTATPGVPIENENSQMRTELVKK
jgi:hypothetical protein